MGTPWSLSNEATGGAGKNIGVAAAAASEMHFGQYADLPIAMVCDSAFSMPLYCSAADIEGNSNDRVSDGDAPLAAPCENNAASIPATSSTDWLSNKDFREPCFTTFVTFLQTEGQNNFHAYRNYGVIDIVRFLEVKNSQMTKTASRKCEELDTFYQSEMAILTDKYRQQAIESESRSEGNIQELSSSLKNVSNELLAARAEASSTKSRLSIAEAESQQRNKAFMMIQSIFDEVKTKNNATIKRLENNLKASNAKKMDLEAKLHLSQDAGQAREREVQRLNSIIQEREKAIEEIQSDTNLLTSESQKLKALLAEIEQKHVQESLTSSSNADDRANPALLANACQSVDTAIDTLARFLHENSITKKYSLEALDSEVEHFIGSISHVKPGAHFFATPAQVKHVWGHWICTKMFQGFEHVFFDIDEERTSPLDFRRHTVECFQIFQEKKSIPSSNYYNECDLFRHFCTRKFSLVFPPQLMNDASLLNSPEIVKSLQLFEGAGELDLLFLDIAKAIWLLHKLAFSFDPPASILRIGWGEPFDKQYHDSLIKDADEDVPSNVVLMLRPGFRVKNTIIKSQLQRLLTSSVGEGGPSSVNILPHFNCPS